MTSTITTLHEQGWRPTAPHIWFRQDGDTQEKAELTNKAYEAEMIIKAFGKDVERNVWIKASKHYFGKGFEKGTLSLGPA